MKTNSKIAMIAAAALLAGLSAASAQSVNAGAGVDAGVSAKTPGHQMQTKGSVKGTTGASGYAPGQKMQQKGSVKGTTGASGYAPGQTTGSGNTGAGGSANVGGSATGGAGMR